MSLCVTRLGHPGTPRMFELKGIQQRSQSLVRRQALKLAQRFDLNLPDAFPSHGKTLADLLESVGVAVIKSEPHLNYFFLAIAQGLQDRCDALLQVVADSELSR